MNNAFINKSIIQTGFVAFAPKRARILALPKPPQFPKLYEKGMVIKMETTLNKLMPGESGKVIKITGEGAVRRRLFDMGITPGAEINVRKYAPLGDPVEINLRGYGLSIRKAEAEAVVVEKI